MSALTLFGSTLASNQTYQFMVQLENIFNSSSQATGYLLVQVDDTQSELIVISWDPFPFPFLPQTNHLSSCVISTLCSANQEYQFVNPTTQVALFSLCVGTCISTSNITWNVYYRTTNASTNLMQWTLFKQTQQYQNVWFFGNSFSHLSSSFIYSYIQRFKYKQFHCHQQFVSLFSSLSVLAIWSDLFVCAAE